MKRRYFLSGGVATLAAPALSRITEGDIRLRDLAPEGLDISSFHRPSQSLASLLLTHQHCSVVVPEFGLKPQHAYQESQNGCQNDDTIRLSPYWPEADKTQIFADQTGLSFHAHTLYWPKHDWPGCFMISREKRQTFIRGFAEQIAGAKTCDVLNEVLWKDEGRNGDGPLFALLDTNRDFAEFDVWSQVLNPNMQLSTRKQRADLLVFIVQALRKELARVNSTDTKLLINEDQLTWSGKGPMIKRKAMSALLNYLESQGARLDGVGLQGHILANIGVDAQGTKAFIEDLGRRNYDVHFSELDYDNSTTNRSVEGSDEDHAAAFSDFLSACLPEENVKRVGFWGLLDSEHHLRRGRPQARPALFETPSKPKPVFYAMADILRGQRTR